MEIANSYNILSKQERKQMLVKVLEKEYASNYAEEFLQVVAPLKVASKKSDYAKRKSSQNFFQHMHSHKSKKVVPPPVQDTIPISQNPGTVNGMRYFSVERGSD